MRSKEEKIRRKHEILKQDVQTYEALFDQDSCCRNLRNYNNALAALKRFEKKHKLSACSDIR